MFAQTLPIIGFPAELLSGLTGTVAVFTFSEEKKKKGENKLNSSSAWVVI